MLDFDLKALPPQVKFRGKIITGARWRDLRGENILLLTQTGKFPTRGKCPEGRCFDAALYAYHYVKHGNSVSLLWRLTDAQRHCPFDLYAGLFHGSLAITDVDSDGIGQRTFVYKLSCRSDVSPARLKLIMLRERRSMLSREPRNYRMAMVAEKWSLIQPSTKRLQLLRRSLSRNGINTLQKINSSNSDNHKAFRPFAYNGRAHGGARPTGISQQPSWRVICWSFCQPMAAR
jgi:hypothetical protein